MMPQERVVLDPAWQGKGYVEHFYKGACELWNAIQR